MVNFISSPARLVNFFRTSFKRYFKTFQHLLSVTRPNHPLYRETPVARRLLSSVVSQTIAATPTSSRARGLSHSKDGPWREDIPEKLASEAYRATGGIRGNSTANRAIVGH